MSRHILSLAFGAALATPAFAQQTPPPDFVQVETQPNPLSRVDPVYPAEARRDSVEGRVTARVWVRADGTVAEAHSLRAEATRKGEALADANPYTPAFVAATTDAVRAWRFSPAVKDGAPVDVWVTIPIRFRLTR